MNYTVRIVGLGLKLGVLALFSCQERSEESKFVNTEEILLKEKKEEVKLSQLYKDDFQVIRLETNEDCLVKHTGKIKFYKGYLYLLDPTAMNLLKFDEEGRFVSKFTAFGEGPGECSKLSDFTIDRENEALLIYDDLQGRIKRYNLEFEFVESHKVSFHFLSFESLSSGYLAFYRALMRSGDRALDNDIIITDEELNIQNGFLPISLPGDARRGYEGISDGEGDDKKIFHTNYAPIVYELSAEKLTQKYSINFSGHILPPEKFYEKGSNIYNSEYIYSYRFFPVRDYFLISYFVNKKHYLALNHRNGEGIVNGKVIDDLGFYMENSYPSFQVGERIGYFVHPAYLFDRMKNNTGSGGMHESLQGLDPLDNPVVLLFELQ